MENLEKILNKERVAYLIENCGVAPWNILAITFTNKAAGEMRERVDRLIGTQAREVWVSTFHSMCVRILRRYIDRLGYKSDFSIYDTDDQRTLMKQVLKELSIDPKMFKERVVLSVISGAKNRGVSPLEFRKEEASGGASVLSGALPLHHGRRVPGYERYPVPARACAREEVPESLCRRR